MNYIGLNKYDTANGPGIRISLFVSGCTIHCQDCFNKESWDFNAGKPFTDKIQEDIIKTLQEPYINGLSILGGDPLEPNNQDTVLSLVKAVKASTSKSIWLWTGRVYKQVKDNPILKYIDVLIDGPYIHSLKPVQYAGSSNQNIIFLRK